MPRPWLTALAATLVFAASPRVRPVDPAELPSSLAATPEWLAELNHATAERLREGEADHLIFYALQSTSFTQRAPIDPAASARAWHDASAIPPDAARRLDAFRAARLTGERGRVFTRMLASGFDLNAEYTRAMRFLYEKEWASRSRQGASRREFVASLYQQRGHSTDSSLDVGFTLHTALEALQRRDPSLRIARVLLVGPGMEWAPRAGFRDEIPPQSHQPYLLADSLLRLKLSTAASLSIIAADVNPRVVDHLAAFPTSPRRLTLHYARGDEDWNRYFNGLGAGFDGSRRDGNTLHVPRSAALLVTPIRLNLLTERTVPDAQYDLAVATNLLLYFNDRELTLALANLAAALRPGGYLIHNDTRPAIAPLAESLGLPVVHARMVRLSQTRELYDTAVIHLRRQPIP